MADGNAIDHWYSAAELAGLPGLPGTHSGVIRVAKREGWTNRQRDGRGGGSEYAFANLPSPAQAALLTRCRSVLAPMAHSVIVSAASDDAIASAWDRYNAAPTHQKDRAAERLQALAMIDALLAVGKPLMAARELVSAQLQRDNVPGASTANLARWQKAVDGAPRADWVALLLPSYVGRTAEAECDPRAWDWYKSFFLTRRQPTHANAYRRLEEIAKVEGWTIPCGKTLQRRLDREIDTNTQVLLREGAEAAARRLPVQQRDRSVFAAGEAVNGDGLKFDTLYVKFDDGEILNTATAWFWQDIRTGRILAWRLGKTENTDLFRLSTYDLTGVCAPVHVWVDNTRVAANKLMTAGAEGRHRFKSDPDDGMGLLLMLGMEPHFTNPDKETGNPGSKPVERAFGIGGIHEMVRTHPSLLDRGFNKKTAISEHELRQVIATEIARFNAQAGRRTQACRGVMSYDQAWEQAIAEQPTRVLSERQRHVLLMCREVVTADKTGMVSLRAGRSQYDRNRYWCEDLARVAGRKLVAHFDPENLSAGIHLYSLDGRYLFAADHQVARAYNDQAAGREDGKFRARLIKLNKKAAAETSRLSELERTKLYATTQRTPDPAPHTDSKVVSGHFQRPIDPLRDAARVAATGTDGPTKADLWFIDQIRKRAEETF